MFYEELQPGRKSKSTQSRTQAQYAGGFIVSLAFHAKITALLIHSKSTTRLEADQDFPFHVVLFWSFSPHHSLTAFTTAQTIQIKWVNTPVVNRTLTG